MVSYDFLSPYYKCYLSHFSIEIEPKSYYENTKDPIWIEAIKAEIQAPEENQIWDVIPLPPGKKFIGYTCVYKLKYEGDVKRFKAILQPKGRLGLSGDLFTYGENGYSQGCS